MDCTNVWMHIGYIGPAVTELESYLKARGLYPYQLDEYYGPGVEAGVKLRQSQLGLKVDGIFGPISCEAFNIPSRYRPVVICSDNITNKATDMKRINEICKRVRAKGLSCRLFGIGPNTHIEILEDDNTPANALVVDVYGGADAGLIYEMASRWYKSIKAGRRVFTVWYGNAKDITGLPRLNRAWDDNYSPASFTGLDHPDEFMHLNGYNYIHSSDYDAIAKAIVTEAILNQF